MKASEIREMTIEDIKEKVDEQQDKYLKLKMNNTISTIENPLSITATRKNIARLKTELKAREIEASKAAATTDKK